jgi:hypothetical protein
MHFIFEALFFARCAGSGLGKGHAKFLKAAITCL